MDFKENDFFHKLKRDSVGIVDPEMQEMRVRDNEVIYNNWLSAKE